MMPRVRTALPMTVRIRQVVFVLVVAGCIGDPGESANEVALAGSTWYFSGTPNNWNTTAMTAVAGTARHETCQVFGGVANPRFKKIGVDGAFLR